MSLLDSSVLIAFFRENDSSHQLALDIFHQFDSFLVLDYVLAETLNVLKQKENLTVCKFCNDFIRNSDCFEIHATETNFVSEVTNFMVQHDDKLSFVDTLLLMKAWQADSELLTFDKSLQKAFTRFS